MCTAIAMRRKGLFFGRNMDIGGSFGEQIVIVPRSYTFKFRRAGILKKHYAMIGMAAVAEDYPLFADAANEKGLCAAGLDFPSNAYYAPPESCGRHNITPFEVIPWVLSKCSSTSEARKLLEITRIVDIPFSSRLPLTPLHWIFADGADSFVLETTKNGMKLYDAPADVLTNEPPYDFQMTNLAQYLNLSNGVPDNVLSAIPGVSPFGKGLGAIGLPGDFSPASRFVKAVYLLKNSPAEMSDRESLAQFFHILEAAAVPRGMISLDDGRDYFTLYSSCIDASAGVYYYRTYFTNQLASASLRSEELSSEKLIKIPLKTHQIIERLN